MSFLKNIWRTSSKHKKLSEECALAKNNRDIENELCASSEDIAENENMSYNLKYLGSTLVDRATNETVTAEAIKTILRVAKAGGKKLPKVNVTVSLNGIKISDEQIGKDNEISIYRISYCSADAAHSRVFAFIAANTNETMECHAFLCSKRKQAKAVTLAVARCFSMAYEAWRVLPSSADKEKHAQNVEEPLSQLIDLGDFDETNHSENDAFVINRPNNGFNKMEWVSFDDDNEHHQQRWNNSQQIDLICS